VSVVRRVVATAEPVRVKRSRRDDAAAACIAVEEHDWTEVGRFGIGAVNADAPDAMAARRSDLELTIVPEDT